MRRKNFSIVKSIDYFFFFEIERENINKIFIDKKKNTDFFEKCIKKIEM